MSGLSCFPVLSTRGSSHSECHNSSVGRDDYTGEETETQEVEEICFRGQRTQQKNQGESLSLPTPDQPFPLNQGVEESLQENLLLSTRPYFLSVGLLFVGLLLGFFFGLVWF